MENIFLISVNSEEGKGGRRSSLLPSDPTREQVEGSVHGHEQGGICPRS